ncbi:MAG: hypothetical protein RLZZ540_310 [Bacteroidota bacterium]|jgi:glycosyltransferase involved in cell wall biosynthesis
MNRILFILHEASETGAPMMINNLLQSSYAKKNDCYVLTIYCGKLEESLKQNAKVSILHNKKKENSLLSKICNNIYKIENDFLKKADSGFFDLIYVNSLATLTRLPKLDFLKNNKSILHIHEGPILSENLEINKIVSNVFDYFSEFIFVSNFAKQGFISEHNINYSKCRVISPVVRDFKIKTIETKLLGLPENSFVVSSSGSLNYNKGVDVFLQIAKTVIKRARLNAPIYFVWVGTNGTQEIRNHFYHDIKKMGLIDNIVVIPNTDKIMDYFRESNLFLLCSREESFSLVAMENAMIGNPVICFDSGNGTNEFINNQNGYLVPYLDVSAASDAILELYNTPDLLNEKSKAIRKMAIDFCERDSAIQIFETIEEVINGR